MQMPFGKFKGKELDSIPRYYLHWLADNVKMNPALTKAVMVILKNEEVIGDESPSEWDLSKEVEGMFRQEQFQRFNK